MDIEKLIELLKKARADGSWNTLADYAHKAATALSKLQTENKKLRETVDKYATAARVIALYLKPSCDESLPYNEMIADAARKVSAELAQVTAERDAAVHDLEEINDCSYCENNCVSEDNFCEFCGVENCLCRGCIGGGNWTWRGPQKEEK